ncbi:MAG TPA: roadblock/LC7 domain-containing protein [Gemmatimonadales bacterium]|nr:roadblock/LC7 domain-containing protein [Gemmatimonadales bacterium]
MPTIRDVVQVLARREGVEAVIVLGDDGLPIDSQVADGLDSEAVAAHLPAVLQACEELGRNALRGELATGVLEYAQGFAVVANLSADAKLLVLLRPRANLGPLLYDLTRHRAKIAQLL